MIVINLLQDSPTTPDVKISQLSPEKLQLIEDAMKKPRSHTGESLHASAEDVSTNSPFKRLMKGAKHLAGKCLRFLCLLSFEHTRYHSPEAAAGKVSYLFHAL